MMKQNIKKKKKKKKEKKRKEKELWLKNPAN
jgi:hypothetical protein